MKRTQMVLVFVLALIAIPMGVLAAPLPSSQINWPGFLTPIGGSTFATVTPNGVYAKSFTLDEVTNISFASCYNLAVYTLGACDYMYKCFIILPQSCTMVSCAKAYNCTEVMTPSVADTLAVSYTATTAEIGKTYAVSAFVLKSHMTYSFTNNTWSSSTAVVGTQQYDNLIIGGATAPPTGSWAAGFGTAIANIVAQIQAWFCSTLGLWC